MMFKRKTILWVIVFSVLINTCGGLTVFGDDSIKPSEEALTHMLPRLYLENIEAPVNIDEEGSMVKITFDVKDKVYDPIEHRVDFHYQHKERDYRIVFLPLLSSKVSVKNGKMTLIITDLVKHFKPFGKVIILEESSIKGTDYKRASLVAVQDIAISHKNKDYYVKRLRASKHVTEKTMSANMKNNLLFVNRHNPLPQNYMPKTLINLDKSRLQVSPGVQKLLADPLKALYNMIDGAKKDGITGFVVRSTYRDLKHQAAIFNSWLEIYKKAKYKDPFFEAQKRVALPGNSEHHTGLAVDILSNTDRNGDSFGKTLHSKWLKSNSWKYGYIVRYPEDKQVLTHTIYEPWHFRYLGQPFAAMMYHENLCLEELMGYLQSHKIKLYNQNNRRYVLIHIDSLKDTQIPHDTSWQISEGARDKYILTLSYPYQTPDKASIKK